MSIVKKSGQLTGSIVTGIVKFAGQLSADFMLGFKDGAVPSLANKPMAQKVEDLPIEDAEPSGEPVQTEIDFGPEFERKPQS